MSKIDAGNVEASGPIDFGDVHDPPDKSGVSDMGALRQRKSHPKVKTGCKTCRARRVKCDEHKPSCLKCIKSRFDCEWTVSRVRQRVAVDPETSKPLPIILPKPRDHSSTSTRAPDGRILMPSLSQWKKGVEHADPARPPSLKFFQNDLEHRYFRVFCEKTASQLTAFLHTPVWNRLVLQASEQSESIRHAIIAIGALEITASFSQANDNGLADPVPRMNEHHRFALTQYSKAITKMRMSISEEQYNLRTSLLSSLLIICFECLHGNHDSAIAQMQSSMGLMEDWLASQTSSADGGYQATSSNGKIDATAFDIRSPDPNTVEDEIVQAFARMDLQATSYTDSRPLSYHKAFKDCGTGVIARMPSEFSSFDEAALYWELVMRRLMHFIVTASAASHAEPSSDEVINTGNTGDLSSPDYMLRHRKSDTGYEDICGHKRMPLNPMSFSNIPAKESRYVTIVSNRSSHEFKSNSESRQESDFASGTWAHPPPWPSHGPAFLPKSHFPMLSSTGITGTEEDTVIVSGQHRPDPYLETDFSSSTGRRTLTTLSTHDLIVPINPPPVNPSLSTFPVRSDPGLKELTLVPYPYASFPRQFVMAARYPLYAQSTLDETTEEQQMHLDELVRWAAAYIACQQKKAPKKYTTEDLLAKSLWLRYLTGHVALSCSLSATETIYDKYLDEFKEIVRIAKILQENASWKTGFTFDLRYIAQLYLTAIRCRDPKVRREAITILLSRPYREGVWDSIVAGKMATAVMEIEEAGLVGNYVPEASRVRGTMMDFNLMKRSGRMKCFLNSEKGAVIEEREISW